MRTLCTATVTLLSLAGCAEFPVYEHAYYQAAPAYYQPARVFYAQAPRYVERTTIVQSAPRVLRETVVVREPVLLRHAPSVHEAPRQSPDAARTGRPHPLAAGQRETANRQHEHRLQENNTRDTPERRQSQNIR